MHELRPDRLDIRRRITLLTSFETLRGSIVGQLALKGGYMFAPVCDRRGTDFVDVVRIGLLDDPTHAISLHADGNWTELVLGRRNLLGNTPPELIIVNYAVMTDPMIMDHIPNPPEVAITEGLTQTQSREYYEQIKGPVNRYTTANRDRLLAEFVRHMEIAFETL